MEIGNAILTQWFTLLFNPWSSWSYWLP